MTSTSRRVGASVIAVALLGAGCDRSSNPTNPSQVNIEFATTDLLVGNGDTAALGNVATVNYTGWLYDGGGPESKGAQFDTSLQAGRDPLVVTIGRGQVIPGFEAALIGMRVGGKRRAYIPSELAFGRPGSQDGTIPQNAAVVFEMDLMSLGQ
jgi:FKBP-type peptidyl-prolyl cis-trans isomerase FkpA